ncbi:MAG: globin domain-containing protein [Gammaproteobacteria bacterium]|nr:globin domain-containing protein [Gammaproteobacteria bacterium]
MTPEQKKLVQSTFKEVAPIAETAAKLFYSKLFELDPKLKALFKGDMEEQGRKLMKIIGVAVNGLDKLEEIVPVVEGMGKRHVAYGVEDKDYNTVGTALLWTLKQGLDGAFTSEVEEAWTVVYTLLADTMKNAAAKAA